MASKRNRRRWRTGSTPAVSRRRRAVTAHRARRVLALLLIGIAAGIVLISLLQRSDSLSASWLGVAPDSAARPFARHVGIISGHKGNDSGAVCPDGLTEAAVNLQHALRIADLLRAEGYTVDVLDEFDTRLNGYRAAALISIHADSCDNINAQASGFKLSSNAAPRSERLVACLTQAYQQRTGLRFHANTITRDMLNYHAFRKIDPTTPAVIIETGFLYLDRDLLTHQAERVAQGIVTGVRCFMNETP
ncbi:MAG: N-acetylmuramoyl-L-alanine amidase [Thermoflexales bacterium]